MIRSLKDQGLSISEISRRLGISRTTVRRYLKSGKVPQYHRDPAGSMIEPYLPLVREMIDHHVTDPVTFRQHEHGERFIYGESPERDFLISFSFMR